MHSTSCTGTVLAQSSPLTWRMDTQVLTHSMSLLLPAQNGAGGIENQQPIGACACGGMLQIATDEGPPQRREIKCSSAAFGGCTAVLGSLPIAGPLRDAVVRTHLPASPLQCFCPSICHCRCRGVSLHSNVHAVGLPLMYTERN